MKTYFFTFAFLILAHTAFGQQIKSKNVEFEDLVTLLAAAGYELFSYDITEMLNVRYDIIFVRKEFETGNIEIATSILHVVSNKVLLTDFPESSWQEIIDAVDILDTETQAIYLAEKINFGFYPSDNDSIKRILINVPTIGNINVPLKMRALIMEDLDKKFFSYYTRSFKIETFEENKFIPLILFGSSWKDDNIYRFCGENEIEPDMSSEILKKIPHYYVIGVKFVKETITE